MAHAGEEEWEILLSAQVESFLTICTSPIRRATSW